MSGRPGCPLAGALYSNDVLSYHLSIKYRRHRGIDPFSWWFTDSVAREDGEYVAASRFRITDGLRIRGQSKPFFTSLFIRASQRFIKAGFQHQPLVRNRVLWPLALKMIRGFPNYPSLSSSSIRQRSGRPVEKLQSDILVVGGGLAGLAAAKTSAEAGADVVLIEGEDHMGGRSAQGKTATTSRGGSSSEDPVSLLLQSASKTGVRLMNDTIFGGVFEDGWLGLKLGDKPQQIDMKAKALILATGARDVPRVFENNDLPGIMSASAAFRLLDECGVSLGRRGAILGMTNRGVRLARLLKEKGASVVILDESSPSKYSEYHEAASKQVDQIILGVTSMKANGGSRLRSLTIGTMDRRIDLDVDFLCYASKRAPSLEVPMQAGIGISYSEDQGCFIPNYAPNGRTNVPNVYVAGEVCGITSDDSTILMGEIAGLQALSDVMDYPSETKVKLETRINNIVQSITANHQKSTPVLGNKDDKVVLDRKAWLSDRTSGMQLVCPCEDITVADLEESTKRGLEDLEKVKRFSGVGTGHCEGKLCGLNACLIVAEILGKSPGEVGLFRQRPPIIPVELEVFAGPEGGQGDGVVGIQA